MRFARVALIVSFAFFLTGALVARAQLAAPTSNILGRVVMVQSGHSRGTTFSLDVDQREYWITAKHILTGAEHPPYGAVESHSVTLEILDPAGPGEKWVSENFSVIDPGQDIDIVVLAPSGVLQEKPLPSEPADSVGVMLGGDCEFLGFAYGGGWRGTLPDGKMYWMPFVKHCTVSSFAPFASEGEGKRIWVLDGINNAGFSGGPVIFRTGGDQKVFAVISGYEAEPTEVISSSVRKSAHNTNPKHKQTVNLNSGFIIAYDIKYAIDAIKAHPIGPLRNSK
jgi:hypothetical protein